MVEISATLLLGLRLMMAIALYAFLGWSILVLWRDLKNQAQTLAKQKVPAIAVSLVDGDEKQDELRFTSAEIVIGRHPGCEWVINNDTVSSRHARMMYHHDQWWLEDLHSRNGTFLNGEALSAPAVLADHDEIRCGKIRFAVMFDNGMKEIK